MAAYKMSALIQPNQIFCNQFYFSWTRIFHNIFTGRSGPKKCLMDNLGPTFSTDSQLLGGVTPPHTPNVRPWVIAVGCKSIFHQPCAKGRTKVGGLRIQSRIDGDKSTTYSATRGVQQNKARKIDTVESSQQQVERFEVLSKPKARTIETDTCPQRTERPEALSKTKQYLRLTQKQLVNNEKCNVSAP